MKDLKKVTIKLFLSFYNKEIDLDVMKSITDELKISTNDEIVQKFFVKTRNYGEL